MADYQGMAAAISEAFDKMLEVVNASKQSVMNAMGDLGELATSKKTTLVEAINELNKTKVSKKVEDRVEIDYIHTVINTDKFLRVDGGVIPTYKLEKPRNMISSATINKPVLKYTDGNLKEINISSMITASMVGSSDNQASNKVVPLEEWVVVEDSNGILANPPLRINVLNNSANAVRREIFLRVDPSKGKGSTIKLKTTNWEGPDLVVNVLHESEYDVQKYLDELVISSSLHPYGWYPMIGHPDGYINNSKLDSITLKGYYRVYSAYGDMNVFDNYSGTQSSPTGMNAMRVEPYEFTITDFTVKNGIHPVDNTLNSTNFFSVDEITIVFNGQTYRRVFQENLDKYTRNKERLQRYLSSTRVEVVDDLLRLVSDFPTDELRNDPIYFHTANIDPSSMMEQSYSRAFGFDDNVIERDITDHNAFVVNSNVLFTHDVGGAGRYYQQNYTGETPKTIIEPFHITFMNETFSVAGGTDTEGVKTILDKLEDALILRIIKDNFYLEAMEYGSINLSSNNSIGYKTNALYELSKPIPATFVFEYDEARSDIPFREIQFRESDSDTTIDVDNHTITVTRVIRPNREEYMYFPIDATPFENKSIVFKKVTGTMLGETINFPNYLSFNVSRW